MTDLRLSIFREMASSTRSRNEYIHQIKRTYGEEAVPEALEVFDGDKYPNRRRTAEQHKVHRYVSINLSWVAPNLRTYQVPLPHLILAVSATLVLACLLIPPFFVTLSNGATTSLGYHFLFD